MQVPEYRDSDLEATLADLLRQADRPHLLRVVVLSQRTAEDPPVRTPRDPPGAVEVVHVPASESRGPNWARSLIRERYDGEDYSLLIDSHLRFVPGWDTVALGMLEGLRQRCEKPVLTGYLPSFSSGGKAAAPYKIYPHSRQEGILTRLTSHPLRAWERLDTPVVAEYLSLHFAFATGGFVTEVRPDPEVYFFGDEVAYGARAYTYGWDLFHPHRVLGWHAYDRSNRVAHWDDHPEWTERHQQTLDRLRRLFSGDVALRGWWGGVRSREDYERHIMTSLVRPC